MNHTQPTQAVYIVLEEDTERGRPKALTGKQLGIAQDLYEKRHPIADICRTLKISRATLYRGIQAGERD